MEIQNTQSGQGFASTTPLAPVQNEAPSVSELNANRNGQQTGEQSQLANQAAAFQGCLDVRDRKYRMRTFKSCFVGSEAVDALVLSNVVSSRDEAVEMGRRLERELRLFSHVTGDHKFADDHLFYRLRTDATANGDNSVEGSVGTRSHDDDLKSDNSDHTLKLDAFKAVVGPLIRHRRDHSRTDEKVFVGE